MNIYWLGGLLFCLLGVNGDWQRIHPKKELINVLEKFHPQTGSCGENLPDISRFAKDGRVFVAKMDPFGLDRYFSFETNEDIKELDRDVQVGYGMSLNWYYFDTKKDGKPSVVSAEKKTAVAAAANDGKVWIKDLPKDELAKALFKRARPLGMGYMHYDPNQELSEQELKEITTEYADYVGGRVMKIDISSDVLNTASYNRNNGKNAAEEVIEELRAALVKI